MAKVTRAKLKRKEALANQKKINEANKEQVRKLYNIPALWVGGLYMSIIDNGDANIGVRLTFTEQMMLPDGTIEFNPVSAVVMNIVEFQRFYQLATMQLQALREAKKIP